jgi:thiol-disulfide isomerase/thioredoxin
MRCTPWLVLLAGLLSGVHLGCGSKAEPAAAEVKKFRPADDATAADARATPSSARAAGDVAQTGFASEPGAAAEATPPGPTPQDSSLSPELRNVLNQINRLGQQQPQGKTEREQLDELLKIQTQRLGLAKQAMKLSPPPELKRQLATMMHNIYQMFAEYRVPSAVAQLTDFGKAMSADPDPEVARIGRHATFGANISRIASQPLDSGKDIVAEVKKLLDAEQGSLSPETIEVARDAANMLRQGGFRADAADILEALAQSLAENKQQNDKQQAELASEFAVQAKLAKLDLQTLLENVIREKPDADKNLEETLDTLLKDGPLTREMFGQVQQVAHILEALGHLKLAQTAYDKITAAFKDSTDTELAEQVAETSSKAKQRMALVGQPFTVEGVQADGSPFDWSQYAGKVVLVDFWASWCGPCLQEIPNIRQNFEQYHAKGFEVVGVNLNTKVSDLKQFLAFQGQEIPWTTVTSQIVLDGQAGEDWTKIPMAAKCGVQAIPFVVLIGKDGNVDSIHVRGPKLGARLRDLLGDPITTEVPADPTQPKPPAKATGQLPAGGKGSGVFVGTRSSISPTTFPTKTPDPVFVPIISPVRAAVAVAIALAGSKLAPGLVADEPQDDTSNPYLAKPGLRPSDLIAFIQKMLDRPQAIQSRPGFADAIVDACDRVLKADAATKIEQLTATQTKLTTLHREACDGKEAADKQLLAFVEELKDDDRPEIAHDVAFFRLERRILLAKDTPLDEIPALLGDVQEYLAKEKLSAKHLRLASSTVAAINRLESGDDREAQFAKFGPIFAKSGDKDLARYGKKLAKKSE